MVTLAILTIISIICTFTFFAWLAEVAVKGDRAGDGSEALGAFLVSLVVSILLIVSLETLPSPNAQPTVEMCIKALAGGN